MIDYNDALLPMANKQIAQIIGSCLAFYAVLAAIGAGLLYYVCLN